MPAFYAGCVPYCDVNGVSIHYDLSGEGFALVLLHANPFDRRLLMYQAAHFSTWFRVINVDLRGYGYSEKPAAPTSIVAMSEEVVAVCRQEGVEEAVVAGVSVGGVIALQLGLDHPEMLRALILVGCSSAPTPRYEQRIEGYSKGLRGFHAEHLKSLVSPAFAATKRGRYFLERFTEWDDRLNASAIIENFRALQNRDQTARLAELEMPVLVMNGELDGSRPRSEEMARRIKGAIHRVVPGAGHACCLEDPAVFDGHVLGFLRQHGFLKG